jgi:hypothetical protein
MITPCHCRICREFDWSRRCWKYVPVRYAVRRQSLRTIHAWLDAACCLAQGVLPLDEKELFD